MKNNLKYENDGLFVPVADKPKSTQADNNKQMLWNFLFGVVILGIVIFLASLFS